jgi:hypothetical protein
MVPWSALLPSGVSLVNSLRLAVADALFPEPVFPIFDADNAWFVFVEDLAPFLLPWSSFAFADAGVLVCRLFVVYIVPTAFPGVSGISAADVTRSDVLSSSVPLPAFEASSVVSSDKLSSLAA